MFTLLLISLLSTLFVFQVYDSSASSLTVAIYDTDSAGVPLIYNGLFDEGYNVDMIDAEDVENGNIFNYDVVIYPGGSTHIFDWLASETYRQNLEAYITNGGKYIGICGGGFLGIWIVDGFSLPQALQYLINYGYLLAYDHLDTKGKWLVRWTSGNIFGECGYEYITWAGGTEYSCLLDNGFTVEARYVFNKPLLSYWGKPAIVSGTLEDGAMILFGPHPEYGHPYPDGPNNMHLIVEAIEM